MREYLLVIVVAGAVTFLTVPLVRALALRVGAITQIRDRDVHRVPIPRLGGVAMLLGFGAAALVAWRLPYLSGLYDSRELKGVLAGAAVITVLGAVDDVRSLDWTIKMAFQILAAGIMAYAGVQLVTLPIGGQTVLPAPILIAVTVLIVVGSTNAVNFVDGLDGLAAGIVAISAAVFFVWSYLVSHTFNPPNVFTTATFVTAALLGVCLGFLPHNFHPARVFMGDAGSLLLGLLLAAAMVSMTGNLDPSSTIAGEPTTLATLLLPTLLPVAIIALPLLDMVMAIVRRTRAGQSPFSHADASHLHHRMLRIGHGHRAAVLLLYLWAAIGSVGAVSFVFVSPYVAWAGIGVAVAVGLVLTWVLPRRARRAAR